MEVWRDVVIPSLIEKGMYQISNKGIVKRLYRYNHKTKEYTYDPYLFVNKVDDYSTYMLRNHISKEIYYTSAHRLVAMFFIPNPDNKPQVNHIDHNPSNNHVSNLEWVTCAENVKHAYIPIIKKRDARLNKQKKEIIYDYTVNFYSLCRLHRKYNFSSIVLKNLLKEY